MELDTKKNQVYFANLDALRFIAFFFVFMFHSFHTEYDYIKNDSIYVLVNNFFSFGHLGVNFFFVLSGFLITYLLLSEEKDNNYINIKKFYVRRILRIWPLYYAVVLFGFVIFPFLKEFIGGISDETASVPLFLLFLSNFNNIINGLPDSSLLGVLWSVSIEEQFYFFWPLMMVLFSRNRIFLFLSVIVCSLAFRLYFLHDDSVMYFHTLSVCSDLSIGGLIGWLSFTKTEFVSFFKKLPISSLIISYSIGLLLVIFKSQIFIGYITILERLIFSIFFSFIILEQIFTERSLFKFGKIKGLSNLGKYTYGLYCLHFIGILIATNLSKILGTNHEVWQVLIGETIFALILTILISYVSYHVYEKPFLKMKYKLSYTGHIKIDNNLTIKNTL